MTMTTHDNAPPPTDWRPPALTCTNGCGHGWHPLACEEYVVAGGVASRCSCPNSAPNVPTADEFLAGRRNPVAQRLRAEAVYLAGLSEAVAESWPPHLDGPSRWDRG